MHIINRDKLLEIFKQCVPSELTNAEDRRVWAVCETNAESESFTEAFGRHPNVGIAANLYIRCLAEGPHIPVEHRIKAVRDRLAKSEETVTGKTAQELEQENEALRAENSKLKKKD